MRFLGKLARGGFGLALTFWFFYVLVGSVWSLVSNVLLAASFEAWVSAQIIALVYWVPAMLGLWRSATRHHGAKVWVILTKLIVAMGALLYAFAAVSLSLVYLT